MLDASSEEEQEKFRAVIRRGISLWDGTGRLVFTSAGSVYRENGGGLVNEESEVKDDHPMRQCEVMVTDAGGAALRFSALYGFQRGGLWNVMGKTVGVDPAMTLEMCNYDDGASAVMTVMTAEESKVAGQVFNVCDSQGKQVPEIFQSCTKVYEYRDVSVPEMTGCGNGVLGKRYDTSKIRALGWKPRWESFDQWCEAHSKSPNQETNVLAMEEERVTVNSPSTVV